MKYIKIVLELTDDYHEAMIAEMLEMEFDGFEQQEGKLIAYISKERFSYGDREQIERLLAVYPGNGYIESEEVVADQNWNEEWEQTIKPQQIGQFFVKPTWQPDTPPEGSILLEIDPKMAFGTGYHETTRLMLKLLPQAVESGDLVLDAGTGTGVLAIGAAKLGVEEVFAFDTDEWSFRNATENVLINQVDKQIEIAEGSTETIPSDKLFDVVLANINRNVIIEMLPVLTKHLLGGGDLVLSGLLVSDKETILEQPALADFQLLESLRENNWIALHFKKNN